MKKKPISIFSFFNNQTGGILLPVMAILVMFTFVLVMVTENHYSKKIFLNRTKEFYLARTIEEMSFAEIESMDKKKSHYFEYNIGTVKIDWNETDKYYDVVTNLDGRYKRTSIKTIKQTR